MALESYQKELFYLAFTGGSGGDANFYIVYDQQQNDIYCTDSNGVYQNAGIVGDPPAAHDGNYSTYYQCHGTTAMRFLGNISAYPYATVEMVAEYASCPYVPNKIRIKRPVWIEGSNTIGGNGTIKIYIENAQDTVSYILDGGTPQSSNTFTGVDDGTHTISVSDGSFSDSLTIDVPFVYNYDTKYILTYKDIEGDTTTINIKRKNYPGSTSYLTGGGKPVELNYPGSDDKLNAIFGSELKLNIKSLTSMQFEEFYGSDNKEYLIEWQKNGVVKWQGYLLTDNYSESYGPTPYDVQITATDNLASLKNIDFLDAYGNQLYGRFSLISIIQFILKQTGLNLEVYAAIDLYDDSMNQSNSLLFETEIDLQYFYKTDEDPPSFHDVLTQILQPFAARIYQVDGRWQILNINQAPATPYFYRWGEYGSNYPISLNLKKYLVGASNYQKDAFVLINSDALLEIIPAWRSLTSKFNPNYKALIGSQFILDKCWKSSTELNEWSGTATYSREVISSNSADEYGLNIDGFAYNYFNCEYIQMLVENVEATTDLLELQVECRMNSTAADSDLTGWLYIAVELNADDGTYYTFDQLTAATWTDIETTNTPYIRLRPEKSNNFEKLTYSLNGIPDSGNLIIKICQYARNLTTGDGVTDIDIKAVELYQLGDDVAVVKEVDITNEIGDYNEVPDDFEIKYSDAPDENNRMHIYSNILRLTSGEPTSSWSGISHQEVFNDQAEQNYSLPTHKISGTMRGPVDFHHVIYDSNNPGRYFIINKLSYNDYLKQANVELYQISGENAPPENALTVDTTSYTADNATITADATQQP